MQLVKLVQDQQAITSILMEQQIDCINFLPHSKFVNEAATTF